MDARSLAGLVPWNNVRPLALIDFVDISGVVNSISCFDFVIFSVLVVAVSFHASNRTENGA